MPDNLLKKSLRYILEEVDENPLMTEDELYSVIIESRFFEALEYKKIGVDIKPQYIIPGERKKPDYICRDDYQNVIFALEAKKPSDAHIEDALNQLWERYVKPLKAAYGVLTNGRRIMIYKRIGSASELLIDYELRDTNEARNNEVYHSLRKPDYNIVLHSMVQEYFAKIEKLSLRMELAKQNFFETFKLNVDSVFGRLILDLVDLFDWIYPRSKFLEGAYGFWRKSFAKEPEKIPDSWKPFLKNDDELFKFMFCLESGHALLARLMLAKACEDLGFPGISISGFVVQKIHQFREQIPLTGYPIVLIKLLKEMKDQLIYSIFEEDIFSWWSDGFTSLATKSSGELLQEKLEMPVENFSRTIARLFFILYKYDFSEMAGDPLGDLYQQYFDRESRKVLGEFYTPLEIVDYILNAVDYRNVRYRRLIDPACGSGTFLVEALHRHLKEVEPLAKKEGWASVLRELCNSPKIVGLDIHPFACLIAQVRFMLELMPYYKKAIEEEKMTVFESLQRLPIFRTDSLAIELRPPEFGKSPTLFVGEEDIEFLVPLPLRRTGGEFASLKVVIPSWKKTSVGTQHNLFNLDEYFCVTQAIFDAVKQISRVEGDEVPAKGLEANIKKYLIGKDFGLLANFFKPYADRILKEATRLKSEFENGRLIKSIEDSVLSALLKNYLQYDFVVGNPPYVRVQTLSTESKQSYDRTYKSAKGNYDIYILFIERALEWLKEGGSLAYICPNRFATVNYGRCIRKTILKSSTLLEFIDFRDSGVFKEVLNYPAILVLNKGRPRDKARFAKVCRIAKKPQDISETDFIEIVRKSISLIKKETDWIEEENFESFGFANSKLTEDGWYFMPAKRWALFEKIRGSRSTMKTFSASMKKGSALFEGTSTGAKDVFIVEEVGKTRQGVVKIFSSFKQKTCELEEEILKPYVENAGKWLPQKDTKSRLIFPYAKANSGYVLLTEEALKKSYPLCYDYLIAAKEKLQKRKGYKARKDWYSYSAPRSLNYYQDQKLLIQGFSVNSSVSVDLEQRLFFGPDIYGLRINKESKRHLLLILGILNSDITNFFARSVGVVHGSGYYKFEDRFIKKLPIALPKTPEDSQNVTCINSRIEEIFSRTNFQHLAEDFPNEYLKKSQYRDAEYDEVQCNLVKDHTKLEPIISGQQGKGCFVYPSKGEDPIWLETEAKAHYLALALSKRAGQKDSTIRILIPKDNSTAENIVQEFKRKMEELKAVSIDHLEKEINDFVFNLYALDESEQALIQNFLKKF